MNYDFDIWRPHIVNASWLSSNSKTVAALPPCEISAKKSSCLKNPKKLPQLEVVRNNFIYNNNNKSKRQPFFLISDLFHLDLFDVVCSNTQSCRFTK